MKQFIVDRHTTPNTPILEQVPTEKIPIYDTEADVDADLANLGEGQIVFTKDLGLRPNDWKQYISDENELSDYESITISTNVNNPTVMDFDGILLFTFKYSKVNGPRNIYVNGTIVASVGVDQETPFWINSPASLSLRKGDSICINPINGDTFTCKVAYYKKRHYEFR